MREIKVRYACKDWSKDNFFVYLDLDELNGAPFCLGNIGRIQEIFGRDLFTGRKDVNGVEIYEGDIVRDCEGRRLTVQFNTEGDFFGLCFQGIITIYQNPHPTMIKKWKIEVIGNIYENPEMLKGQYADPALG